MSEQQEGVPGGPASTGQKEEEDPFLKRVKVYQLRTNSGEQWAERGTGCVGLEFLEKAETMGLVVVSDGGEVLLVHKLMPSINYQRSAESTIITWTDPEMDSDLAISFQEKKGCAHVWEQLQTVLVELRQEKPRPEEPEPQSGGHFEEMVDLPMPSFPNLESIAKALTAATPFQRERMASSILKPGWIPTILDLFKQAEDLDDMPTLGHLFRIIRGAIMLNEAALLEEMLKEEYVMDVVGALEYDPELRSPQRHRQFLAASVTFKEVVPIKDKALLARIHQTYRIQYIKDVILPRALDDATYATLSSLALFNNVEVVGALAQDPEFLSQLFAALQAADPGSSEWGDLVAFLQEFCNLARHLPPQSRTALLTKLVQLGLYEQITRIMHVGSEVVKLRATDVLLAVMQHDTESLRQFLTTQKECMLLSLLVHEFAEGTGDGGLAEQVAELLKLMLDPESMQESLEKNAFVELFYERFLQQILEVLKYDLCSNRKEGRRKVPAHTVALVIDLLCFLVQHHLVRIKYFALRNTLVQSVVAVLRRPERWLACAAVRFLRTCISAKDEFYIKHLVQRNAFESVITAFVENGERYNMLNSAVLELLDFIRKENIKVLVAHIVESYGNKLEDIEYVDTYKQLKIRYEQNQDGAAEVASQQQQASGGDAAGNGAGGPLKGRTFAFSADGEPLGLSGGEGGGRGGLLPVRRRRDERGLDKDEEDYFADDGDDEEGEGAQAGGPQGPPQPPPPGVHDRQAGGGAYHQGHGVPGRLISSPGSPPRGGAPPAHLQDRHHPHHHAVLGNHNVSTTMGDLGSRAGASQGSSGSGPLGQHQQQHQQQHHPPQHRYSQHVFAGRGSSPSAAPTESAVHAPGQMLGPRQLVDVGIHSQPQQQHRQHQSLSSPQGGGGNGSPWPGLVDYADDDGDEEEDRSSGAGHHAAVVAGGSGMPAGAGVDDARKRLKTVPGDSPGRARIA